MFQFLYSVVRYRNMISSDSVYSSGVCELVWCFWQDNVVYLILKFGGRFLVMCLILVIVLFEVMFGVGLFWIFIVDMLLQCFRCGELQFQCLVVKVLNGIILFLVFFIDQMLKLFGFMWKFVLDCMYMCLIWLWLMKLLMQLLFYVVVSVLLIEVIDRFSVLVFFIFMLMCSCGVFFCLFGCMLVSSLFLLVLFSSWLCVLSRVLWFWLLLFFRKKVQFELMFSFGIVGGGKVKMKVFLIWFSVFIVWLVIGLMFWLVFWFFQFLSLMKVMFVFWFMLVKLKFCIMNIDLIVLDLFFRKWFFSLYIVFRVCFWVVLIGVCISVIKMFWFLLGRNELGRCVNSRFIIIVSVVKMDMKCYGCVRMFLMLCWQVLLEWLKLWLKLLKN